EDLDNMKTYYFRKLEPLDTLIQIQKDFPDDASIAKVLAERLSGPFISEKEMMLQQYLIQEFKLDASKFKKRRKPTEIKEVYNVAVLFPFMLGSLEPDKRNRPNQFVIDMYEGIRIAVDSLKKQGVSIKLFAYETERDSAKFAQLLAKPELKTMDLIIGPVFAHHHEMLGEFAYNNQINVVNPFGNSLSLVKNNEFMYLYQPALETQAHKMATLAGKSDSLRNRVIILYGESSKDSVIAYAYRDSLKHLNYTIHKFLKVNKNSVREIKTALGDSLALTKVNHIFVPSSDQVVAATVVSSMDVMRMDIPIVGYSEWINIQLMSYDQLERRKVHFLMPEYIDYTNPSVRNFKKAYIKKLDVFPSVYSYQGYELMYVFGMHLKKYGNVFNDDVRKCGQLNGTTMGAFDYSCSNSNQVVPVIRFENSYLKPVSEFKRPEYISAEDLNPKKKK
ncbi:MAG: ABC transporter substrate-binding protein, partial [Cytophagaceae bacterium]